ncbi:universal stress protein [Rhodovulum adriaticum]|uniref:Nucleotide-binding universal stress UspA family protein n=1 Tax=Rhodovulum adriaticum TaxID=35804 RepID=A0A4R2NLQ4_RHOAD|nr:universal stress protein [Rhodovulum adriaticum]MBK1636477.1 universal stress protein UspA [Rhodovulum adriaticum]TCP22215.1 nucleotide-binding universal stress UspA family protein [Rhodovulum adriaticum]
MLSKILVPVRGDGMSGTVLGHAAELARRHRSHVVVVHCRAQPEDMLPYGVPLPSFARDTFLKQAQELADQQEQHVREELHQLALELGLSETDPPHGDTATVEFVEEDGRMADVIKHNGRLADLVVVAKPDRDRNVGSNSLKSGLFRTGRPVLMCPRAGEVPKDFGARIAIGWNGSLEAARAVALTLDFAKAADAVTILTGGKGEPHGATTEELVEYYALRGITAQALRFEGRNPGAALLEKTVDLGANLLVMGAYGQSHERETLFGGNTQTVVDKAEIPVVLVH